MPEFLDDLLPSLQTQPALHYGAIATLVLVASAVTYFITKRVLVRLVTFFVERSSTQWDDMLLKRGVFDSLAWLAPALILYYAALQFSDRVEVLLQRLIVVYMQLVLIRGLTRLLSAVDDIWASTKRAREVPIRGYLQVARLLVILLGGVIAFGTAIDRSPWALLSGVGAATAILLLVFKDTILSFVASIQIASTGTIRIGDWVSMPQYRADGDVIDIALHRVTIQNWDKTLTAIPTHKFLDEAFTNWRGMSESGGRRIMRSVFLDQTSVRFLGPEDIERLSKIQLLKPYIEDKTKALEQWNSEHQVDGSLPINGRRLTNIGTFRAYLVGYLKANPKVRQDMTFLVRQLAPSPEGVGIQIYVFTNDTAWANYEAIQADIFDHVLAAVPEFGLRVFQNPTGADFRGLVAQG